MIKLGLVCLGVILCVTPVHAIDNCYTRGKNTYCDSGAAWHKTPNGGIVPWGSSNNDSNPSYHKYGKTLYGSDNSIRTKDKKGNVNARLHTRPSEKDAVLNSIFGDGEW
jgi:hypothetical protein